MASTSDKITDVRNAGRPNSASVSSIRAAGGTTLSCDDLTGWPTASKVHFVTYQVDSNSDPIPSTQLDCSGIVSGNNINSFTVIDGTDSGNSVGDIVEMLPTAAWGQDLADALTDSHNRDGSLKVDKIWPVGSIYISVSSTNPSTYFGGTWTSFGAGRTLVGFDSGQSEFDTVEETGGEKTHTLTTAEMPAHTHNMNHGSRTLSNQGGTALGTVYDQNGDATDSTGGGGAHNNLQPYIVTYFWKRTE